MTEQQQQLARKWCELVGWRVMQMSSIYDHEEHCNDGNGFVCPLWYLFSPSGQATVKKEMAKRLKPIASLIDSKLAMAWWPITDINNAKFDESEPHAVLLAAVAAMEKKG